MKRFWVGLIFAAGLGALSACAGPRILMQTAPSTPKGAPASPALTLSTRKNWEDVQRGKIKALLEDNVYGHFPQSGAADILSTRTVAVDAFEGTARVTEVIFNLTVEGQDAPPIPLVLVTPNAARGPVPIILMENFCPNNNVIPIEGLTLPAGGHFDCSGEGLMANIFGYFFGRYITTPPIKMIMDRGYALAVIHPPQFVPDRAQSGLATLQTLQPEQPVNKRWSAIAAWGWQASRIVDYLEDAPQFSEIITYGHSRYGKSALLAAAFDARIDGAISHQSGTGGASLSRDKPGETVTDITQSYPHWFSQKYASYAGNEVALPIDQHHLLALIAPRPIMLGNAKRDVWSDPEGAFRAAKGANPAYELYGSSGLTAERLTDFRPKDDIAFWMRPGTHGVVEEDWPAFLEFLDAHFKD